jgi:hypothetical protein
VINADDSSTPLATRRLGWAVWLARANPEGGLVFTPAPGNGCGRCKCVFYVLQARGAGSILRGMAHWHAAVYM